MRSLSDGLFVALLIVVAVAVLLLYKEIALVWDLAFRHVG